MIEHLSFLTLVYVRVSQQSACLSLLLVFTFALSRSFTIICHVCRSKSEQHGFRREDQPVGIVRSAEQLRHQQPTTGFHSITLLYNKSFFSFHQHENSFFIQLSAINGTLIIIFCLYITTSCLTLTPSIPQNCPVLARRNPNRCFKSMGKR